MSASCYQACDPHQPRVCPAKAKERQGCACDTLACAQVCRHATPHDPQARFIVYTGSNQSADSPNAAKALDKAEGEHGEPRYGYRSLPLRLADPSRRFSLTLLDDLRPANLHEDLPAAALLLQLKPNYPDLQIDAVAGDAAYGFDPFLHTVYARLAARRVIDCRAHATDRDHQQWVTHGYGTGSAAVRFALLATPSHPSAMTANVPARNGPATKPALKGLPPCVALPQVSYLLPPNAPIRPKSTGMDG